MFDIIHDFFNRHEWEPIADAENSVIQLSFYGKHGYLNAYMQVLEDKKMLVFYTVCPLHTPPEYLLIMSEFLHRVNAVLLIGNFELNMDEGGIRYKTSLDVSIIPLTDDLIKSVVEVNPGMMDRFYPALMAIIQDGAGIEEAFEISDRE